MKKVQQIRSLAALWRHRTALFNMGRDVVGGRYKMTLLTVVALIMATLYIVSPIDLIPDIWPVVGWLDDGFVFYFLLKRLMAELERYEGRKTALRVISK